MKHCYTLLFLLLLSLPSKAQNVFAPIGAEWYHDIYPYGVFHDQVTGNVTIQGKACRRITQTAITSDFYYQLGLYIYNLNDLYVYNNADTVFVYSNTFQHFIPLYVFNVATGDTLHLPVFDPTGPYSFNSLTDSTTTFVVDSVKTVLYDTAHLKTVFTRNISSGNEMPFSYSSDWSLIGSYAEKIGSVGTGFLPQCLYCWDMFVTEAQCSGAVRCYHDSTTTIQLATGECDKGIVHTAVNMPLPNKGAPYLFPNPAASAAAINGSDIQQVMVTDMQGKVLLQQHFDRSTTHYDINLQLLPPGMYMVRVQQYNGENSTLKLAVVR